MAITSFYLLNMFPRMRTLHHHPTAKHVLSDAHFTSSPNNQHSSPRQNMFPQMCTLSSSPNNQHPSPKQNMFPRMRTLHHHPIIITHHPTAKHVPSDAHFTSSPNSQHLSPNNHERNSIDFSIKLTC